MSALLMRLVQPRTGTSPDNSLLARLTQTRDRLGGRLWMVPLLLALLIGSVGFWTRHRLEAVMQEALESNLRTLLDTDVSALRLWLNEKRAEVKAAAADPDVRDALVKLLEVAGQPSLSPLELAQAPQQRLLRERLRPLLEQADYTDFMVATPDARIIASSHDQLLGLQATNYQAFLRRALEAGPQVTRPFPSRIMLPDAKGQLREGVPTMLAIAPVLDAQGRTLALLALRLPPAVGFNRLLAIAWLGRTGETCAFDREGRLLSPSRFESQLKQLGLIPNRDEVTAVLNLELRNPGVNLADGTRPSLPPAKQPLILPVASAIAGNNGVNVRGYPDCRGVPVVGAWTWLADCDFGLFTQMDRAEAYHPLHILRTAFSVLFAVLLLAGVVLLGFVVLVDRFRRSVRRLQSEVRQLGQYTLGEPLGSGATGKVYRAHHAFLRRPVAVKLLDPARTTPESEARFELEVQTTSRLTHPNTIAIYDFGRTPEGVFYCAMECLDGLDLRSLVRSYGPLPEGRVIHILRQACGSLAEAHAEGLVHRDIKPANLILGCRGGVPDFLKVLDFGMVKALNPDQALHLTLPDAVVGTPLYLSPEAVDAPAEVDAQSDLYSLGAVGYYLLTGKPLFEAAPLNEVLRLQVSTLPPPPSERLGQPVSPDLEKILMSCLAKNKFQRPASARELEAALAACRNASTWSPDDAQRWWLAHAETTRKAPETGPTPAAVGAPGR